MQRQRYRWTGCLVLTATLTVIPLMEPPSAQAPAQGSGIMAPPPSPHDETAQRLLVGPDGQVYRLWLRRTEFRTGGGGVFLALASPGDTWKKLLDLIPTERGVTNLDPDAAFGASKEIAVAYQWRRHDPRIKYVRVARSNDGGQTWITPTTPIDAAGKGFTPKVAWGKGQTLVVAWMDERRSDKAWDIYARRSPDGGVTWEPEQKLSRFARQTPADLAARPEMISDGQGRFWVVWIGLVNARSRLYLNRSSDDGRTWTDPVAVSGESESVFGQRLLRQGERILLVWQDARTGRDRNYSIVSGDGGTTWTEPIRVDHLPGDSQFSAGVPSAVLGPDGEAFVTWSDGRNGRDDIFVARSTDWGRTWGTNDVRLDMDEPGTAASRFPKIARADGGQVAIAWEDDRAGHEAVHLRIRGAGPAAAWGPEVIVQPSSPKRASRVPTVAWGHGGTLYVGWDVWDHAGGPKQVDGRVLVPDKQH
jgi:hypothetical protein